jgi:hypothetical protein
MDLLMFLGPYGQYVSLGLEIVGIAAAVAAVTPTKKDDKFIGGIMKVINVVGLNVGKAKNAG